MTGRKAVDFAPGTLLASRYRVVDVAGRGGLATVYRAEDESLHRTVALKVIHGSLGDADEARRHEDEVRLIAGFNHPGLVTLFDVVTLDDEAAADPGHAEAQIVLVMQFVDGADLASRLRRGAIGADFAADIGADVADVLAYIHGRGVMHRDVKPANILLPASGTHVAMLADFGIARLVDESGITSTGLIVGTASYLSPEQAAGEALGPATDIYSLGLVLLECLTGERAFPGSAVESVAARLSADPTIPASVNDEWREVLQPMLTRDPAARPAAVTVAEQLRQLAGRGTGPTKVLPVAGGTTELLAPVAGGTTERLVPAATAAPVISPTARARRNKVRGLLFAIGAGLLGILVILLLLQFRPVTTELPTTGSSQSESPTPTPTPTVITYPEVDGPLGDRLADLEDSVADLQSDEATEQLQALVLIVAQYAAAGDFESASAALDDVEDAVDNATLTATERDDILSAIDDVRTELDKLLDPHDGPGNSDHKHKKG